MTINNLEEVYTKQYDRTPYAVIEEVESEWTRFKVLMAVRCPTKVLRRRMNASEDLNPRMYWNGYTEAEI
jgi:hypothetical protein